MNGYSTQGVDKEIVDNGGQSVNVKTVELPVIPREVALAIEYVRDEFSDEHIIMNYIEEEPYIEEEEIIHEYFKDLREMLRALINGYTIAKSPEEQVREYYKWLHRRCATRDPDDVTYLSERKGVLQTLNLLGIKIEGVND